MFKWLKDKRTKKNKNGVYEHENNLLSLYDKKVDYNDALARIQELSRESEAWVKIYNDVENKLQELCDQIQQEEQFLKVFVIKNGDPLEDDKIESHFIRRARLNNIELTIEYVKSYYDNNYYSNLLIDGNETNPNNFEEI